MHESRRRKLAAPLAGIQRRKLGLESPPGAIPNFGAGHEIKSQPRFVHAVLTCWLGSQPPCRSRVPGRRAHRTTPFPTQNFLPSMDLKEQNNLVRGNRAKNFVRKKVLFASIEEQNLTGNNPPSSTSSVLRRWCCFSLSAHLDHQGGFWVG